MQREFEFVDISNSAHHNEVNVMQPSKVGVYISNEQMNKARTNSTQVTITDNYTPSATPTPTPSYTPYASCYASADEYIATTQGTEYAAKGSDKFAYTTSELSKTGYSNSYSDAKEYVNTDSKDGYSKSAKVNQEYVVAVQGKGYSTSYDGPEYVISY